MSLKIFHSDRIESLAEHLKERLLKERKGGDPFAFSQVVVPNTNIAKWLQMRAFADEPSLAMGIEFPFIEQCLFKALADCMESQNAGRPDCGFAERPSLLPMNAYANGIMAILLKDDDARLAPFRRYIAEGDGGPLIVDSRSKARMAWQLAVKLADLMDKYEVHRQGIVEKWLDERRAAEIENPTEMAEAALAQKLLGENGIYPPAGNALSLRQLFERASAAALRKTSAATLHFFGLSTLSSLQVSIIRWLAQAHDIEIYHNNVCLEYWGDIETKEESVRRLGKLKDADDDIALESPLLQNWGRAGRETLRLFVDLEEANGMGDSVPFEWNELPPPVAGGENASMLQKTQASVRNRMSDVGRVERQDASIQVVGAPGPRREVEMAYNAILGAVWKPKGSGERPWGDCTFSDIAVLVPDMKTYRPIIEAVFDGRGEIPYGLIDTSASEHSRYLNGFMALMAIAREGLSRETLFAALDNSCVQRALGFTSSDVREWRRYADGIGAFDGFDGEENARNVSWSQALARLRLGMVAKDRPGLTVWEGGEDSALKFSEIVETLHRELSPLAGKRLVCTPPDNGGARPENWADALRRIAAEFLANDRDDMLEEAVSRQLFQTLQALDRIEGAQGIDFVVAAVEEFVGGIKCQRGGYLTHGVTIAGLQPMRPVPFKQVFVLGMGEGMFPGRDSATTLEIRGAARTLGDMGPAEMNKYLFLETLMATRERLVISYPNLDIVKDAEMFPSGIVRELEDFLEKSVLPEGEKFREVRIPLLERGERDDFAHDDAADDILENPVAPIRWSDGWYAGIIPTYSNVERGMAAANSANVPYQRRDSDLRDGSAAASNLPQSADRITVTAKELAEFLESPLRAVLRRRCGIAVEGYRDDALEPDAPLELESKGPVKWALDRELLAAVADNPAQTDVDGVYRSFAERGYLPENGGMLGAYSLDKIKAVFAGKSDCLGWLKRFYNGFSRQEGGKKPNPVRIVSADGRMLYAGQTKEWSVSQDGSASRALVFGRCGDAGTDESKWAKFPPKAVLEPFITWMMMVAGEQDEREHSLRVGVVDVDAVLCNAWDWRITPSAAGKYVGNLADAYLRYLDEPDAQGLYLDYGYSKMTNAIADAIKRGKIGSDTPKDDGEWKSVIDGLQADDFRGSEGGFNNGLVVEQTVNPLSRQPDSGVDYDLKEVGKRFETLFKPPMSGMRDAEWGEGA